MKRKPLCFLLTLMITLCLMCTAAYASDSGSWGSLSWELNDAGTLTISGTGAMSEQSGTSWASHASEITAVVVSQGVTDISSAAFNEYPALTSATIAGSVSSIGLCAFSDCPLLSSVTLSEGLQTIGEGAFESCPALTSVTIPSSVKSIENTAFAYADVLTVTFSGDAPAFGSNVFAGAGLTVYYSMLRSGWADLASAGNLSGSSTCSWNDNHAHEYTIQGETASPTCTDAGYTVWKCPCGADSYTETLPALGHDFSKESAVKAALKDAATCASPAVYYLSCSRCGAVSTDSEQTFTVEGAGPHSLSCIQAKDPTYEEAGTVGCYHCDVCGKYFTDLTGSTKLSDSDRVLPKLSKTELSDCTVTLKSDSFTYTGKEIQPAVYSILDPNGDEIKSAYYSLRYESSINAGTGHVILTAKSGNIPYSGSIKIPFTIEKADPKVDAKPKKISGLAYTGKTQALVTAGICTGGKMYYALSEDGTYSSKIPTATAAGDYEIYYKVVGDGNHTDIDPAGPIEVSIDPVAAAVKSAPGVLSLTYTGKSQTLISAGKADGGSMVYCLERYGDYSAALPAKKDAGTYKVYYKAAGDSNHTDSAAAYVSVTIAKAAPTLTKAPAAKTLTYNGTPRALLSAGKTADGTLYYSTSRTGSYSSYIPTRTNAGTYTAYYKIKGDSNHKDSDVKRLKVTIHKKAQTVILSRTSYAKTTDSTYFYLSARTGGSGSLVYRSSDKKVAAVTSTGRVTIKGAGTAVITIYAKSTKNYKRSPSKTVTITVSPIAPKIKTAKSSESGCAALSWSRVSGADGYEIRYVLGKQSKTIKVSGADTLKKTIKSLSGGKTYRFSVRSYVTVDGAAYYSKWSAERSLKITK